MQEIFSHLFMGFGVALAPFNIMMAGVGAVMGLVVGAMPGIGSLAGVALLLPLTFKLEPTAGIIMLASLYYANMYGGSFSAILLNIPGDSPAVMTAIDGYKITQKGRPGKALFTAIIASFTGGTVGILILTFMGPLLAEIGLKFGPVEMTMIILMALTSIGWVLGDNPIQGLVATGLGLILATIGVDLATGYSRFAFGVPELLSGINFVPLVIGMFGFSQVMILMQDFGKPQDAVEEAHKEELKNQKLTIRDSMLTMQELAEVVPTAIKTGFCGTFIGVLPGAGATMAAFMCYILEKKTNRKRGPSMGEGELVGVAAPEGGNNGAAAGAFAPLLSLGLPGSGTTAVLLGGLMMWGLRPGPLLFSENPDFAWGLIASMYIGNMICVAVAIAVIPFLVHILRVPKRIIVPIVTVVCVVGSYSVGSSLFDVGLMLAAGVIGYYLLYFNYPIAPLLLAFVLAPILEKSLNASFAISGGDPLIFVRSPIAATFLGITVAICLVPVFKRVYRKVRAG